MNNPATVPVIPNIHQMLSYFFRSLKWGDEKLLRTCDHLRQAGSGQNHEQRAVWYSFIVKRHFVFWVRTWVNRYPRLLTRTIFRQIAKKSPEILRFQGFVGIPTARGYNAPCFEGMVHYFMGSILMHRDNEDRKDNIKSAYRTL